MGREAAGHRRALRAVDPVADRRAAAPEWIAVTKLTAPSLPAEVVVDPDLLSRTAEMIDANRLTLIVAPSGSGKTTLARAAVGATEHPVAWLRLHPTDDEPRSLIELVAAAVDRTVTGSCAFTLELLRAEHSHALAPTQLAGALLNDLAGIGPVRLVLDDLHHLGSEPTLEAMAYLLEFAPPHFGVVATCRRPPALPLSRLRAAAGVGELLAEDLRLTPATASAVLSRRGIHADDARVSSLLEMSNGWLAGFLLAARAPTSDPLSDAGRSGAPGPLSEYLAEEIVGGESPSTQWFLRASSILEELDPDRCAAVTGVESAAEVLVHLQERLGFFLVEQAGVLRYHELFADHLRGELQRHATPAARADLLRRAAAPTDLASERIPHLLAAGEHETASGEIEALARSEERHPGTDRQVLAWIEALDPAVRSTRPWLDLVAGVGAANEFDGPRAERLLTSVLERARAEDDYHLRWLAAAALGRATHDIARWASELGQLEHDPRFQSLPASTRADWLVAACWGGLWSRDLDTARARAEAAIAVHRDERDLAAAETLALHLGVPLAAWPGALDALVAHHRGALQDHGHRSWVVRIGARAHLDAFAALQGQESDEAPLTAAESRIVDGIPYWSIERDFAAAARASFSGDAPTVHAIVAPLVEGPSSGFGLMLAPMLAASYRQQGLAEDLGWLQGVVSRWTHGPPGAPAVAVIQDLVAAEVAWACGRTEEAEELFTEALDRHAPLLVAPLVDPGCELAVLRAEQGRTDAALAVLAERLDHLVGRLRSPGRVAKSGLSLVPLLERLAAARHPWPAPVLAALGRVGKPDARRVPATGERLTSREVEVLRLLADGASNAELADQLHLSMNTVKTHVKRVLAKLGAASRTEAAVSARRQHLV